MTMTSLSLTFVYNNTADMARARATSAPPPATPPVAAPDATDAPKHEHLAHDTPRRSPLFRALLEALGSLVAPAAAPAPGALPGTAAPVAAPAPAPAAATPAAGGASAPADGTGTAATTPTPAPAADAPATLDDALMNFARALMQALRSAMHGGGDGEGHHHSHHDHGRRAWGDPAQRIAQLGTQVGAATPAAATPAAPSAAPATAASDTPAAAPAVGDTVLDPVAAIQLAPAGSGQTTVLHVSLTINGTSPGQAKLTRTQQALIDAFGTLQQARAKPAATDSSAKPSLQEQLSAFLKDLADKLRQGNPDAPDATQPGAMLHVTA